jgi:hypothetical protein
MARLLRPKSCVASLSASGLGGRSGGVGEGGSGGTKKNASVSKPVVPAQGWVLNDKGEVVLTAYNPNNTDFQRFWGASAACPAR